MSLSDAMRTAIANEINERHNRYGLDPTFAIVHPNDVTDIEFVWDEGETSDNEDYDLSPRLPSMEIRVVTRKVDFPPMAKAHYTVNASIVLNALLQAVIREGL